MRAAAAIALGALLLALPGAVPAEAAVKATTHCSAKAKWSFVGEDESADVRVKLWKVVSKKKGWTAFCGEAWDVHKTSKRLVLVMEPNNRGWMGLNTAKDSAYIRWDAPTKDLLSYYAEANLAYSNTPSAAWTVWVKR